MYDAFNARDAYVTEEFNRKNKKSILKQRDLLLVQSGVNTGEAGIVGPENEGHNCHALIVMTPISDRLNSTYFSHLLNSESGRALTRRVHTGATIAHLNCHNVKDIVIPLPPIGVQNEFAALVEKVEGLREKQRESKQQLENLFNSLMQRAFRGELVQ